MTESYARHREAEAAEATAALDGLHVEDPAESTRPLGDFDGADKALQAEAEVFLRALQVRHSAARQFLLGQSAQVSVEPLPPNPAERLASAANRYRDRAITLRAVATDSEVREALEHERNELEARRMLSMNLETVLLRRRDLEQLHRIKACRKACDTEPISRKITELRRQVLTEQFKRCLEAERAWLDIQYIPLKVADRSDYASSYVGVSLDAAQTAKSGSVLSEGERNALALSSFLAEIACIPGHSGLIFDDPVSSLDHRRRRKVAERLVVEAQRRQVIVFTHDLVFFHELNTAAAAATPPVPVATHEIRWTEEHGFGTVFENEEPWLAKKVGKRLPTLEAHVAGIKGIEERAGDKYRKATVAFYSDLRQTWESLIENDLLNGVVTRFQTEVKTQSLREVVVEDEDHRRIYFAMKRASEWLHDQAAARPISLPDHSTAASDLEELRNFWSAIKARKKDVQIRRKRLEGPPVGILE